jgi:hypothetical protein
VFRSDLIPNPPPPLLTNDDRTASDHLPVLMLFANPYAKPFRLTSITRTNSSLTLRWESVPGQRYQIVASSNFSSWTTFASNMTATTDSFSFTTNIAAGSVFFRVYRSP